MMEVASVKSWAGSVSKDHSLVVGDASGKSLHGSCHLVRVWGGGLKIGYSEINILRLLLVLKHTVVSIIFIGINFHGFHENHRFKDTQRSYQNNMFNIRNPYCNEHLILLNDFTRKSMNTGFQQKVYHITSISSLKVRFQHYLQKGGIQGLIGENNISVNFTKRSMNRAWPLINMYVYIKSVTKWEPTSSSLSSPESLFPDTPHLGTMMGTEEEYWRGFFWNRPLFMGVVLDLRLLSGRSKYGVRNRYNLWMVTSLFKIHKN